MNLKFISRIVIISLLSVVACKKGDGTKASIANSLSFEKIIDLLVVEATKQVTTITGDGKMAGGLFKSENDFKDAIYKAREAIGKASDYNKLSANQKDILKNLENKLDAYEKNYLDKKSKP